MDGHGVAPGIPNLAGQSYRYLVTALSEYRQGQRIHAAVKIMAENLTEAGERAVAAYFSSLPPAAPAAGGRAEVFSPYDHGKELAQACTQCHGPNGNSAIPGTPSLSGQQPGYFVAAIQEYLTGARETPPMHSLIQDLKALDFDSLALYFASQTPAPVRAPARGDAAAGQTLTTLCARLPRIAGRQHQFGDPQSRRPGSPISRGRPQGVPRRTQARGDAARGRRRRQERHATPRTSPRSTPSRRANRGRARADPGSGYRRQMQSLPQRRAWTTRRWRYRTSGARTRTISSWRCARIARTDGKARRCIYMTLPYGEAIIEGIASYYASQARK